MRSCEIRRPSSCPESYSDNDNHYIFFNDVDGDPDFWRSEPTKGEAITPFAFGHLLQKRVMALQPIESMKLLFDILTNVEAVGLSEQAIYFEGRQRRDILELTHDSLTIGTYSPRFDKLFTLTFLLHQIRAKERPHW